MNSVLASLCKPVNILNKRQYAEKTCSLRIGWKFSTPSFLAWIKVDTTPCHCEAVYFLKDKTAIKDSNNFMGCHKRNDHKWKDTFLLQPCRTLF